MRHIISPFYQGEAEAECQGADGGGEITDDEHRLVAELLELAQFFQRVVDPFFRRVFADPNARARFDMTPLHWAADAGHKDVAELLLANKADVNAKNNRGETPLFYTKLFADHEIGEMLRQHGGTNDLH